MEQTPNRILLRGSLHSLPTFSHENHFRKFWRFVLEVPRLSGTVDLLPVIADEAAVMALDPFAGQSLRVEGQIRSHNIRNDSGRHLMIFLFASALLVEDAEPINEVYLEGTLCKQPILRTTPLGREICDLLLAVPRQFHRADYLPCILWGRTAQAVSCAQPGHKLQLWGRLQSRNYTKLTADGPEQRTAYEISAMTAQLIQ